MQPCDKILSYAVVVEGVSDEGGQKSRDLQRSFQNFVERQYLSAAPISLNTILKLPSIYEVELILNSPISDVRSTCLPMQQQIVDFLIDKGIAIYDTAVEIERGKNDASDANLNILERVNLAEILSQIPDCTTIVSTGGKSAEVVSEILGVKSPEIGDFVEKEFCNRVIKFYRMPSSSRAYPMKVDKKAEIYSVVFKTL